MVQSLKTVLQQNRDLLVQQDSSAVCLKRTTELSVEERKKAAIEFMEAFNPRQQMQVVGNPDDCLFGPYWTLAQLKVEYGKNTPVAWLVPQLLNLSEFCGCKGKLSDAQLEECAFTIATEYYYLKVSELMLFFHKFKAGYYGKFYGNVDPMVITTSLRTFVSFRNQRIWEKESEDAARKREEDAKNSITWEEYCRQTGQLDRINKSPLP